MLEKQEFLDRNHLFDNEYGEDLYRKYKEDSRSLEISQEQGTTSKQYISIMFNKIDCPEFRERFKSPLLLYFYIRRFVVRKYNPKDKYDIYGRYFKNDNKFACTMSIRRLAKDFRCSTNTIQSYLNELEECGFIEIETIKVGRHNKQSVYILGGYKAGEPTWFIDEVPTPEKLTVSKSDTFNKDL